MTYDDGRDGRRALDEAVARARALGTAWVRHYARAGADAPHAQDLRLEGAVDLRRRICVAGEADHAPARVTPFAGVARRAPDAMLEALGDPHRVVYAGGSRYVAGDEGWQKTDGDVEGPRLAADPVWLLDALAYAAECVVTADGLGMRIFGRLDLSQADDIDRSALLPVTRWKALARSAQRRRRDAWLRRVPFEVALDGEGRIASMAFAMLGPGEDEEPVWTTTEVVEYGVPVDLPDLMARSRPAAWRGRAARAPMPTR